VINMPGGPEIAIILVIALIVLGPQQLPKAMRSLGNAMAEIRKLSSGFQAEMRSAMDTIETQGGESTAKPSATTTAAAPVTTADPGVTEVVARNPAVDPAPATTAAAGPTGTADPVASTDGPPPVDPADRAAG
jgi:sec-independent protein translocase protein TatB